MQTTVRPPRRFHWLVLALALLAALGGAGLSRAAPADQAAAVTMTARAGFDGYFRDGQWLPVRVTLENNGPDARGRLQIVNPRGFAGTEIIFTRDLELPSQSRREFFIFLAPEGFASSVEIRLQDGATALAPPVVERLTQLSTTDLLYGILAGTPSAFNVLADVDPFNGQAYVAQLQPEDLPSAAVGWQALDVLVVSDVDTGALTPEQRAALAGWVQSGGRLLVMGGPGWQKAAAGVSALLPLAPDQARPLADVQALADYAATIAVPAGEALAAVGPVSADAVTLVAAGSVPLVVARSVGFGQVVSVAVDLAFAPLRAWDGAVDLYRRILSVPVDRPSWAPGITNWSSAQSAVDALPDLQLPSPLLICGFLGLYLAIVGPVNYLVLRFIKRRELAWLTIPGTVVVFSLIAYIFGYGLAGSQPTLHELAIVQAWPGEAQARLDQVVGVFSPRRSSYDLEFAPGLLVRPMPGLNLPGSASLRVEQGERTRLYGVRTEIASVQTFVAQGLVAAPVIESDLRMELIAGSARLLGTVTNQSALTLQDAVLLAPGGTLRLGEFRPGETRNISLILSSGRASSTAPNSIVPYPAGPLAPGTSGPYYPGTIYDTTIDDILGNTNYYSDRLQYRRFSLLSAAVNTYNGATGLGRGGGLYLVGWGADGPAPTSVVDTVYKTEAETVYLIGLDSTFEAGGQGVTVVPGLMLWMPLAAGKTSGAAAPYDATLYPGDEMAFRFTPIRPLFFSQVSELRLRVSGSSFAGVNGLPPEVALWDFAEARWVPQDVAQFGEQAVPTPNRYVGEGGEIRARLSNRGVDALNLSALEFTLTVEP